MKIYESFEVVLVDEKVDVVFIVILNDSYKELVIIVFEVGKYVVCEKLVIMISEDLLVIMDVVKRVNKYFMVY